MSSPKRTYGGATADERRNRRRAAIFDAVLDIVAVEGVAGLGVKAISAQAGLNDRYFYENFPDTETALTALADNFITEAAVAFADIIDATKPVVRERVRAGVETALDLVTTDERKGKLLVEAQSTAGLRRKRHEAVAVLAAMMTAQGRELLGTGAPAEPEATLSALTAVSGSLDLVAVWLRGEVPVDRDVLVDFLISTLIRGIHPLSQS